MRRSTASGSTTCGRTSTARTTAARPGRRSSTACPDGDVVNAVREDPVRKGLLFAGTERAVYVSFNDGDNWQPLRLNMPATSIRDLVVHDDDIVVGTHGRVFWILDDITPLRQIDAQVARGATRTCSSRRLAYRVRRSVNTDTPMPPEEPTGQNPPDGAIINYYLKSDVREVTLEILDSRTRWCGAFRAPTNPSGSMRRGLPTRLTGFDRRKGSRRKPGCSGSSGTCTTRRPKASARSYPISAIYRNTPTVPMGPTVLPGQYSVKLTVNGKSYTEPLTVKMDPRVTTPPEGLAKMFALSFGSSEAIKKIRGLQADISTLRVAASNAKRSAQGRQQSETRLKGLIKKQPRLRAEQEAQAVQAAVAANRLLRDWQRSSIP